MNRLCTYFIISASTIIILIPNISHGWNFKKKYKGKSSVKITNCEYEDAYLNGARTGRTEIKLYAQWDNKFWAKSSTALKIDSETTNYINCDLRGKKKNSRRFRGKALCSIGANPWSSFAYFKKSKFKGKLKGNKLTIYRHKLKHKGSYESCDATLKTKVRRKR